MKSEYLQIRVPKWLKDEVKRISKSESMSMSEYVMYLIAKDIIKREKEI